MQLPPPVSVSINKSRPSSPAAIPKDRSICCMLTTAHRNLHTPCPSTPRGHCYITSSKQTVSTNTQASQQGIVQKDSRPKLLAAAACWADGPTPTRGSHQPHACRAGTPCAELHNTSRQCHAGADSVRSLLRRTCDSTLMHASGSGQHAPTALTQRAEAAARPAIARTAPSQC